MPTILWHETNAAGYTDRLPAGWFETEGTTTGLTHIVTGPRGGMHEAQCDVTVNGCIADLDYEAHAAANRARGMFPGVLRLEFSGPNRRVVERVFWREPYGEFERFDMAIELEPGPAE